MTAPKKAPAKRQQTGSKPKRAASGGTQAAKGSEPKSTPDEVAQTRQENDTEPTTYITATNTGSFQLRAAHSNPDGSSTPEWTIEFDQFGLAPATEDDLAAVKKVLAGEWSDRRVAANVFAQNARFAGLGIRTYGMEQAPIQTWEQLEPEQKVVVAIAAGNLATPDAVKRAIRYEKQSDKREPKRDAHEGVLAQLEAHLSVLEAQSTPSSIPVVNHGGGGTVVGTAGVGGLFLERSELG